MREIKFRGMKDNDKGEWVYGYLTKTKHDYLIGENQDFMYWVKPETVGQFTGLKDCNGVGIYEGDILAYTILNKKYKCEVVWGGDSYRCIVENLPSQSLREYLLINSDAKVIGNIYEKG